MMFDQSEALYREIQLQSQQYCELQFRNELQGIAYIRYYSRWAR
jgi:hypothetical protein